jgi:hypothetical protein
VTLFPNGPSKAASVVARGERIGATDFDKIAADFAAAGKEGNGGFGCIAGLSLYTLWDCDCAECVTIQEASP